MQAVQVFFRPFISAPSAARILSLALCLLLPLTASAADGPAVAGIPIEFILFGCTLLGVALFHHHTLAVGLTGLVAVSTYKLIFTGFPDPGVSGLLTHFAHEWVILANLFCLLMGFALLARHFEESHVPIILPNYLPDDWKGGFMALVMVFVLSSFLDNIAAALIGGAMAHQLFQGRVHIGYLAAIVAASNAGGSGSVVGDTTTTMMWIEGVSPLDVITAYSGAFVALFVVGIPAAIVQQRYSPILKDALPGAHVDWPRLSIVAIILFAAMGTNIYVNALHADISNSFPFIGVAVWVAIVATVWLRRPDWKIMPETAMGSVFLLSLVSIASMMPVEKLPLASWETAMGLGFVSAVFDNIPLTALALKQGGYDWGVLAYCVGFGGSMIWFGSSAGVALSNMYPEARSVTRWLKEGWFVVVGYVLGFAVMMLTMGWHPHAPHKVAPAAKGMIESVAPEYNP